jgi:hypothetical protein
MVLDAQIKHTKRLGQHQKTAEGVQENVNKIATNFITSPKNMAQSGLIKEKKGGLCPPFLFRSFISLLYFAKSMRL